MVDRIKTKSDGSQILTSVSRIELGLAVVDLASRDAVWRRGG
jgi:hypothetical protein